MWPGVGDNHILPRCPDINIMLYFIFNIIFCVHGNGTACIERSEDNLQELVFYLHRVGHRGQTQVIRLGLYSVSHLIIYAYSSACVCV